jgi:hypothetical protein
MEKKLFFSGEEGRKKKFSVFSLPGENEFLSGKHFKVAAK